MKAQFPHKSDLPEKPEAWDVTCFILALAAAVGTSFALHLFPAEGVFVFFVLLLLIGLLTALTHHTH